MEANSEETKMKLLLKDDVISGFSYSFTKALLEKLEKLKTEKRIFEEYSSIDKELTSIAKAVIICLEEQTHYHTVSRESSNFSASVTEYSIEKLVFHSREFLAIFETKES